MSTAPKGTGQRPNILFITSDQQRGDCYGFERPEVQTPHLDRLARDGTRFKAAITPNLVCQPSRASMLTGMLPLTHGVWDNGVDLDPAVGEQGFAGALARAGYATAFIGKAHFATKATFAPTGTPEDRFNGGLYDGGWMGPYMGFQHAELMVLGHMHRARPPQRPIVGHYERWLRTRGRDEDPRKTGDPENLRLLDRVPVDVSNLVEVEREGGCAHHRDPAVPCEGLEQARRGPPRRRTADWRHHA
jgi:arylsulfatase A-like enzyme